jgi:hypothetical protein
MSRLQGRGRTADMLDGRHRVPAGEADLSPGRQACRADTRIGRHDAPGPALTGYS